MTQKSEQINDLLAALAKAQAEIEGAAKDSANPHYKSRYADLASVWAAARPALTKHGLSVIQAPDSEEPEIVGMTTILAHSSGQWISSRMTMRPVKTDPHGIGAAITYCRRYALAAMVGVAPEDADDDGNAAMGEPRGDGRDVYRVDAGDALAKLIKAIDANDCWAVLEVAKDQRSYMAANSRLDSKQKKAARDLEQRAATARVDYVTIFTDAEREQDDLAARQAWDELSETGKAMVWAQLEGPARNFIRGLKKDAA